MPDDPRSQATTRDAVTRHGLSDGDGDARPLAPATKVLLLRNVPLLAGLEAEQLLAVAEIADTVRFHEGDWVFSDGEVGDRLFIIASGSAEVLKDGRLLARLSDRDCFGEMALLDGGSRSASVQAADVLTCLAITRDDFGDLLEVSPSVAKSVMSVLTARLRGARTTAGDS